ncbi:energy-coupling factor transporter transmembrane component T [Methanosarcina sp.]|uniref:energy-coupling factor transporter transmembrane component T family protein n=1 Tax=Methanosarcina sp. TaxID=2213 RepID=UPI00298900AD|nr:energy-coupling factor transporter transmembrane component T [Methanosarcina sp.]MDW5550582.1 energy-coupling factor transporter transmembrane component T [Methanosarcina sp.]MDW5554286.1 energy-coupling factor transporter transmembrane component T [Methanosarcina sp.]MDW5559646.1 energy-coupling factor transporter transmembrane component T [Methanosarcina sp.]
MIGARSIAEPTIKDTVIHRIDPRAKILILISIVFVAVSLDNQKTMFLLFLTVLSGFVLAKMPAIKIKTLVILLVLLIWGTIYSQALFYSQLPRTVIFTIIRPEFPILGWLTGGGLFVYEEGFHHGAVQGLRSASILSLGLLMCWTTDSRDMLNGLVGLRVPYSVAFMVITAVRFLPIIITEVATVITVQRLRGFNPTKFGSGIIKTLLNILTPTLANCVRRTGTLAISIQSRAFRANPDRTSLKKLEFSDIDKIVVAVCVFTAISVVIMKLIYNMYTSGIYYTSGLRPVYAIAGGYL